MDYSKTTDDYRRISADYPDEVSQERLWTGTIVPDGSSKISTSANDQEQTELEKILEKIYKLEGLSIDLNRACEDARFRNLGLASKADEEPKLSAGIINIIDFKILEIEKVLKTAISYIKKV